MKFIAVITACLAQLLIGGCAATSISETISVDPKRIYHTGQMPADALSSLSLVADDMGLRTDVIDQQARRVVISNPHPFLGYRMSMIVFGAEADSGGSVLSAWDSGQNPIWWDWVDKLWERYSAKMQAMGVQTSIIKGRP